RSPPVRWTRAPGWRVSLRGVISSLWIQAHGAVFGQLQSPIGSVLGVDFKKAGTLIASRQAVFDPENCEAGILGTHKHGAVPRAPGNVVNGMDIIVSAHQIALINDRA